MKKILQTCFLVPIVIGILCLPMFIGNGSEAKAQVADSPTPGPDLVYLSGVHRGGVTLSDTFPRPEHSRSMVAEHSRSINTPHEIDGGPSVSPAGEPSRTMLNPWSVSRLPSSSRHVDPGLKEETASLRASARSDVSTLPSSVSGRLCRAESKHLASFSLVDQHLDPGAGEEATSLQPAPVTVLTLKGLLKSSPTEKHRLSYKLSTQEIDPYYERAQLSEDSIALLPGSFYAGTSGRQVFELQIPVSGGFGRLAVYDGGSPWLEDIWVRAGDSLLLHREGSRQYFSGPSADAVRLQIQLQELFAASVAEMNPVMILSDAGAMLNTPEKEQAYRDAVESYVPGWSRHMVWLESEADKMGHAKQLFDAGDGHPLLLALERNRDLLDAELHSWLYAYWKGRLATQALQFVSIAKPASPDWASLLMENSLEAGFVGQGKAPAELVEALYQENKLLSTLTPVSFLHLSESLPDLLEEQVNALYLVREYKELSDADSLFRQVMGSTQSPEILLALEQVYRSGLRGRDFADFGLEDGSGRLVYPEEWKGKIVLLDFWLSGCGACLKFAKESFLSLLEEFAGHPELVLVTVAGDSSRELWLRSLASGRYTNSHAVNLYSGGISHPTLRQNLIQSFPTQLILDREGRILQTGGFPEDRQGWVALIQSYLDRTDSAAFSYSTPKTY